MPLTQDFSVSQTKGAPSIVKVTDNSTGSDGAVTQRRVYLVDSDGEYVVPDGTNTDYVNFPIVSLSGDVIQIDCLDADAALDITVQWLNAGNTVLYSKTYLRGFTLYNRTFLCSLTQSQASQSVPHNVLQDSNYANNKMNMLLHVDSGDQAITYGSDITTAQTSYDFATLMRQNENIYF